MDDRAKVVAANIVRITLPPFLPDSATADEKLHTLGYYKELFMKREQWGSRVGFVLVAIGSAISLGNIWRFPYMAYENGGVHFSSLIFSPWSLQAFRL
ncbi:hypothetical protein HND97_12790 [Vibrio cholerae]|nr:hypothetical protein HND97_12790 [Vibrio cholerae]